MRRRSLYKYVSKREHAEYFLNGGIFFRSLAYFRDFEDHEAREDKNEGVSVYRPVGGLQINNQTQNVSFVMPGWSFITRAKQKEIFVYCLSRSLCGDLYKRFGAVACVEVCDFGAFCARVEAALPPEATFPRVGGQSRIGHRVDYYKPTEVGNPRWALPDKIATSKLSDYMWQKEFRLVFGLTNAFEFQNVETFLEHESHRNSRNPDEHLCYEAKAKSLRDICRLHLYEVQTRNF